LSDILLFEGECNLDLLRFNRIIGNLIQVFIRATALFESKFQPTC